MVRPNREARKACTGLRKYYILILILQNTTPQALYFHFSSCINKGYVMIVCMYRKSTIRFYFVSRHACGGGKAKINVGKKGLQRHA